MTQDVLVSSLPAHVDHASDAIISTIIGECGVAKRQLPSTRAVRRAIRPPQNSMMRLAVLNALRSGSCYSRF